MTIYAIGDIHGHLDKLKAAHARVEDDRAREGAGAAALIHLGDLVDRGPDSAGVVAYLSDLAEKDDRVVVLRGNHDQYMIDYLTLDAREILEDRQIRWTDPIIGGQETMASYGVRGWGLGLRAQHKALRNAVPKAQSAFLTNLPYMHELGECVFVHAGIAPGVPLPDQDPQDMLWIRNEFLLDTRDHGPLIVHGHTPVKSVEHWGNRLAVDTGAGFGGPLSAVAIDGRDVYLLTDQGRVAV
ncbi:MAG: metallophosphoesterase family protein [Pseudomonadota bacterium]